MVPSWDKRDSGPTKRPEFVAPKGVATPVVVPTAIVPKAGPGRPAGVIDKRQVLAAVDALIDEMKRIRDVVERAFVSHSAKKG